MSDGPEFNPEKHIIRLREGAEQAMSDALYLIQGNRISLSLFAAHLAIGKAIKAHVVKVVKEVRDIPPFIHNLPKLAELAKIELTEQQRDFLADLTFYNISGRYQESIERLRRCLKLNPSCAKQRR